MAVALQLYSVREHLARDFGGTLRRVRDLGFRAVETYPFPGNVTLREAASVLASLQLQVISMHCDLPIGAALPGVLEMSQLLDCRRCIWHGWPRPSEYDSMNGIEKLAGTYNEAGAVAQRHGVELGLHNHWWEFEPVEGRYPYQLLNQRLQPEIFFEIDTYWVQTAGLDPARVIAELKRRVRLLHLKDGPAVQGRAMTALGSGKLNFPAILGSIEQPLDFVVELDECETDIFEALAQSVTYLRTILPASNF